MTYALLLAFFRNDMGFGGNNGLTDFKDILGYQRSSPTGTRAGALFAATAIALALGVLLCDGGDHPARKLGKLMIAVRDAESRTRYLGYRPEHGTSCLPSPSRPCMAGHCRRALCAAGRHHQSGRIRARPIRSRSWCGSAVGGRGTIIGPIIGAHAGQCRQELVHRGACPELWLFALGGLFVFVTLFLPRGIVGTIRHGWGALTARRASQAAESGTDATLALPQAPEARAAGPQATIAQGAGE